MRQKLDHRPNLERQEPPRRVDGVQRQRFWLERAQQHPHRTRCDFIAESKGGNDGDTQTSENTAAHFNDLPHFAGGIIPGDGIFTTWSYRAGAGRAEAFLLNPAPISAEKAADWGVVSEVVEDGQATMRARGLAEIYLKQPEVTRRDSRIHFIQTLKERIVREVG